MVCIDSVYHDAELEEMSREGASVASNKRTTDGETDEGAAEERPLGKEADEEEEALSSHRSLFVGRPALKDIKAVLDKKGYRSEFVQGVLVVNDLVGGSFQYSFTKACCKYTQESQEKQSIFSVAHYGRRRCQCARTARTRLGFPSCAWRAGFVRTSTQCVRLCSASLRFSLELRNQILCSFFLCCCSQQDKHTHFFCLLADRVSPIVWVQS
jgi:hypothetical protein